MQCALVYACIREWALFNCTYLVLQCSFLLLLFLFLVDAPISLVPLKLYRLKWIWEGKKKREEKDENTDKVWIFFRCRRRIWNLEFNLFFCTYWCVFQINIKLQIFRYYCACGNCEHQNCLLPAALKKKNPISS